MDIYTGKIVEGMIGGRHGTEDWMKAKREGMTTTNCV